MSNRAAARGLLAALVLVAIPPEVPAAAAGAFTTAAYSRAEKGYQRKKLPDGTWAPEYYAIANGGMLPGTTRDTAMDKVKYPELAGLVAMNLARRQYFYAANREQATLLVVVHWGRTIPFNDLTYGQSVAGIANAMSEQRNQVAQVAAQNPDVGGAGSAHPSPVTAESLRTADEVGDAVAMMGLLNRQREQANEGTARLLGYLHEINEHNGIQRYAGGGHYFDDLVADIEEPRYYVIVSAYDFRAATTDGKLKLQWITRISIPASGHGFADRMATMLAAASRHFGEDSGGLRRRFHQGGRVEIGDVEVVGTVTEATVERAKREREQKDGGQKK